MMNISVYRADYLPLIGQLMNQMSLPQINNEKVTKPNSQAIEYVLSAILVIRILKKKCEEWVLSKELNNNQKRILKLAGFDERIYYKTGKVKN